MKRVGRAVAINVVAPDGAPKDRTQFVLEPSREAALRESYATRMERARQLWTDVLEDVSNRVSMG